MLAENILFHDLHLHLNVPVGGWYPSMHQAGQSWSAVKWDEPVKTFTCRSLDDWRPRVTVRLIFLVSAGELPELGGGGADLQEEPHPALQPPPPALPAAAAALRRHPPAR